MSIFDNLLKIGDVFENRCGDKMKLVKIDHERPENFVYEFECLRDGGIVSCSASSLLTHLKRV